MADILSEHCLGISAAARYLAEIDPAGAHNPAKVWRWMSAGVANPDGQRVTLERARLGRRWLTSREALSRFAARLATSASPTPGVVSRSTTLSDALNALKSDGFFR